MKPLTLKQAEERGYYTCSYDKNNYYYEMDGIEYLIRNGKEIAKGDYVWSYRNGDYSYEEDGVKHIFNKHGKEI